jgi:hypothetical protein
VSGSILRPGRALDIGNREVNMKAVSCRWTMLVLIAIFLSASGAHATDLTLFLGGAIPGKLNSDLLTHVGQTYHDLTKGPIFGLRLHNSILPVIGLEHTLAFSTDYLSPKSMLNPQNARGFIYNTNLLVNIPLAKIMPYATAGVGIVHQYGLQDSPIGTKLAFNYGGGLKLVRLAGPLGLRFDIRGYRAMKVNFLSSEGRLNILEASAGLVISLDR